MVQTLEITTDDGTAEALLAGGGGPGVLFYMDAFGLRPQIATMVERIASWGYTVLAPHVFYRDGSVADLAPKNDLRVPAHRDAFFAGGAMGRIRGHRPQQAARDAEAYVATLAEHAAPGPIGTTGYCMGARLAMRLAGQLPEQVRAVGGWHGGGLVTDAQDSPHLAIAASSAAYALGHADHDPGLPPEAVETLEQELRGRPHLNEVFAGAPHGYTMADTSAWHAEAAARHDRELRALLDTHLRG
jgi:carboxymethylenebutenolidase